MSKVKKPKPAPGYKIAGRSADGIPILEPKTRPSHFTSRQMKSTVKSVIRAAPKAATPDKGDGA